MKKNKNGITLIALVITIIILLVLAGISISLVTGQNGVLTKAKDANSTYNISSAKEQASMRATGYVSEYMEKVYVDNDSTVGAMTTGEYVLSQINGEEDGDYSYSVSGSTITVTNKKTGQILATGTIEENGGITWNDSVASGGNTNPVYDIWDGESSIEPTEMSSSEIHIYTCAEMKWLEEQVNAGTTFEGYTVYLENNLDFGARPGEGETEEARWETASNEAIKWTPIGSSSTILLKGTFDGKGHKIKGIYVNQTANFSGLFGNSSTIQNLTIADSYIKGGNVTAGIVGALRTGKIENCHNENTIITLREGNYFTVGGLIGQASATVKDCTNSGKIIIKGMYSISGFNVIYCGGITGTLTTGTFCSGCINYGNIISESEGLAIGGICGQMASGSDTAYTKLEECSNYGNIEGYERIAGIVGAANNYTEIKKCYNTGNVIGSTGWNGGINASTSNYISISDCYNKGNVSGGDYGMVAGYILSTETNYSNLYYLSSLGESTKSWETATDENFDSLNSFLNWLENQP